MQSASTVIIGGKFSRFFVMLVWFTSAAVLADDRDPSVLIMGDSLSAGYGIDIDESWTSLLTRKLRAEGFALTVVNASISGETTSGGATRMPALLEQHNPAVVIIALGANDGLRGIPFVEMKKNLNKMIRDANESGAQSLVIRMHIPPNYGPLYTERFDAVFDDLEIAGEAVMAPFILNQVALNRDLMQSDGLHPTAAAQPLMLKTVWPTIALAIEQSVDASDNEHLVH